MNDIYRSFGCELPEGEASSQRKRATPKVSVVDLFKKNVGRYDLFSAEQEKEINARLIKIKQVIAFLEETHGPEHVSGGLCEDCRLAVSDLEEIEEKYVLHNLRLILSLAGQVRFRNKMDYEDLIQEGYFGLRKAVKRLDPRLGKLSTYATWWINHYLRRGVSDQGDTVRIPVYMQDRIRRTLRTQEVLRAKGVEGNENLANEMDLDEKDLDKVFQAGQIRGVSSLDNLIDGESGNSFGYYLTDETAESAEEEVLRKQYRTILNAAISRLPEREQEILRRRMIGEETLEAIGDDMDLSRERIRQIEADTMEQLRLYIGWKMKEEF